MADRRGKNGNSDRICFHGLQDMILYIENPNDACRKPELINEFDQVSSYKIKTQKSLVFLYTDSERSLPMVTAAMKFKEMLASWKESDDKPRQHIKKERHYCQQRSKLWIFQ